MISLAGGLRIYVATRPTDFRKGIDGLALVVQETLGLDRSAVQLSCFVPSVLIGSRSWSGIRVSLR
jgi:transposase